MSPVSATLEIEAGSPEGPSAGAAAGGHGQLALFEPALQCWTGDPEPGVTCRIVRWPAGALAGGGMAHTAWSLGRPSRQLSGCPGRSLRGRCGTAGPGPIAAQCGRPPGRGPRWLVGGRGYGPSPWVCRWIVPADHPDSSARSVTRAPSRRRSAQFATSAAVGPRRAGTAAEVARETVVGETGSLRAISSMLVPVRRASIHR